jgi:molybdenum cofactor synthesis domain-containing protein
MSPQPNPTACILVIGNEILSGRTQDINVQFIARRLGEIGIALREVRVIPDVRDTIVNTVVEMRARFDHVFTTGGIGPTHDDITSACVAEAFGVPWEIHPPSFALLEAHYGAENFNAARRRMATLPRGAVPIPNSVSVAPGFTIGNVHVMAGVPSIMQAMLDSIAPTLKGGATMLSETIEAAGLPEGRYAGDLGAIAKERPAVSIGSYPAMTPDGFRNRIVVRSRDPAALAEARSAVEALVARLSA